MTESEQATFHGAEELAVLGQLQDRSELTVRTNLIDSHWVVYLQLDDTQRYIEGGFIQRTCGVEVGDNLLRCILGRTVRVRVLTVSCDANVNNFLRRRAAC